MLRCCICEEAGLKPAAGSTMIMENERPLRIANFEICERTAVLGCDRLCCSNGGFCGSRGGTWVVRSRCTFGVSHGVAPSGPNVAQSRGGPPRSVTCGMVYHDRAPPTTSCAVRSTSRRPSERSGCSARRFRTDSRSSLPGRRNLASPRQGGGCRTADRTSSPRACPPHGTFRPDEHDECAGIGPGLASACLYTLREPESAQEHAR